MRSDWEDFDNVEDLKRRCEQFEHRIQVLSARIDGLEFGLALAQQEAWRRSEQLYFLNKHKDSLALAE